MRLRRWVKNERIAVDALYLPFAQQIVQALVAIGTLVVVMDASRIGRRCQALMVGVVYKQRALPLAWVVYRGKTGQTTAQRHIQALQKVLPLIPEENEVILPGDAEYDTTEMVRWGQAHTSWQFVLRISSHIHVVKGAQRQAIGAYILQKGRVFH